MTIPDIRARLYELADEQGGTTLGEELRHLGDETWRRRTKGHRSYSRRTKITDELMIEVQDYHRRNPSVSQQDIADLFDVNIGRVSEILHGKRT